MVGCVSRCRSMNVGVDTYFRVNIKKIHVRLLDRFGDVIDLNNMDYSFSLELEILYDRNQIRVAN